MAIEHVNIVDPYIHEPKGVASALSEDVYIANGVGSGNWASPLSLGSHAEIYITGGTTAHTLNATAGVYDIINPSGEWTAGDSGNGAATTPASGILTITSAGVYHIAFWMSFDTAALAAGTEYYFQYDFAGTLSGRTLSVQKNTAGVDRINISASGLATLTSGSLSIHASGDATSKGTNITPIDAGLMAFRVAV